MPGCFSECDEAILFALLDWKRRVHKGELKGFDDYHLKLSTNDSMAKSVALSSADHKSELNVSSGRIKKIS